MSSMLLTNEGKVHPVDFPEVLEDLMTEPLSIQMKAFMPEAFAIVAYTSVPKENGYSYSDLIKFADETLRDEGFTISLPFPIGRVQFTPKKKYDPAPDVEKSLDFLLDSGIFTEKYVNINGVFENRYFLMPAIAEYMENVRELVFRPITFYDLPEVATEIYRKLRMEDSADAKNT